MDSCDRCLVDPHDYQARADLMWTATLALNGLTAAGLGRVGFPMHMIEHSLSALYDVPHGAGLSMVIPGWLRWHSIRETRKIIQLGERIFDFQLRDIEPTAYATIKILENWFSRINSPIRLSESGIPPADIPAIADNALKLAKIWRLDQYSREDIEGILSLCR